MEDIREALANHRTQDAERLRAELDDAQFYLEQ